MIIISKDLKLDTFIYSTVVEWGEQGGGSLPSLLGLLQIDFIFISEMIARLQKKRYHLFSLNTFETFLIV